jgi:predicted Zn-dependent protease
MRRTIALSALLLVGCATNPVTGRRELSLIPESQEIQMGREASTGDVARVGEYANPAAQSLVKSIGQRIAAKSERPNLPWEFHLLDDAAVNAFAYPGGFIFVTRGLMTYLNSEAELAEVIGHEVGHVTAKHTVAAMSKQQVAQIGLLGASIFSPSVAKYGDLLGTGASLLFLKFGRDDEMQADALGFRYSLDNGYDVREAPKVFSTLGRLAEASGARIPEWQSTHPDPGNRVQKANERLATVPATQLTTTKVNRANYLQILDGMVFGDDPRQGYFRGTRFVHPELRFELTFPTAWKTANQPDAVLAQSAEGTAQMQLAPGKGTPAQALAGFLGQQGITVRAQSQNSINGLTAASAEFDATTQQGSLRGLVTAVQLQNTTYLLLGITSAANAAQFLPTMDGAIRTFRPLTDASLLNVTPARLQLVTLSEAMTGLTFTQRYPSTVDASQVYIINAMDATTSLPRGAVLKRVVGGLPK